MIEIIMEADMHSGQGPAESSIQPFVFDTTRLQPFLKHRPLRSESFVPAEAVVANEAGQLMVNENVAAYNDTEMLERFMDERLSFSRVLRFDGYYVVDDSHMDIDESSRKSVGERFTRLLDKYAAETQYSWQPVYEWVGNKTMYAYLAEVILPRHCNYVDTPFLEKGKFSILHYTIDQIVSPDDEDIDEDIDILTDPGADDA
jgi:hypothetical protein